MVGDIHLDCRLICGKIAGELDMDTLDKIIPIYFASVTNETFYYKNKKYEPQPLIVSPLLLRNFTCPPKCGGCCPKFTLDYIPSENKPDTVVERVIDFNNKQIIIYTDDQKENLSAKCKNLNFENGRCNIHKINPFSCDFELIRFLVSNDGSRKSNYMMQRLFGRGWNMMRIDGSRGALCEMTNFVPSDVDEVVRKLNRLNSWLSYFEINNHKVDAIIRWAEENRHSTKILPLKLNAFGESDKENTIEHFFSN